MTEPTILAFGAHPDDIEFFCGGVIAGATRAGQKAHFVVCSRGESGTRGTPAERAAEATKAAGLLGATLEFIALDGDAHLEEKAAHAIALAAIIRRVRPTVVLAPVPAENQHPDHRRLGRLVRDAARLARYGGVAELKDHPAHAIGTLFFYASSPEFEPASAPVLIDVSDPSLVAVWKAAMEAHASQMSLRHYVEVQIGRSRQWGLRAGVEHAIPLYPADPLIFGSLDPLVRSARHL